MFCAACRALLEQIQVQPIGEEDIQYHAPSVELDAAIDSNCSLCRRMGWRTGDHRNGSWSIFTSPYDWPESESLGIKIPGTISLSLCKPGEIEVFKLFKLVPVTTKTGQVMLQIHHLAANLVLRSIEVSRVYVLEHHR
jgi:hypothetical protein